MQAPEMLKLMDYGDVLSETERQKLKATLAAVTEALPNAWPARAKSVMLWETLFTKTAMGSPDNCVEMTRFVQACLSALGTLKAGIYNQTNAHPPKLPDIISSMIEHMFGKENTNTPWEKTTLYEQLKPFSTTLCQMFGLYVTSQFGQWSPQGEQAANRRKFDKYIVNALKGNCYTNLVKWEPSNPQKRLDIDWNEILDVCENTKTNVTTIKHDNKTAPWLIFFQCSQYDVRDMVLGMVLGATSQFIKARMLQCLKWDEVTNLPDDIDEAFNRIQGK
jgi:hypothetical protein